MYPCTAFTCTCLYYASFSSFHSSFTISLSYCLVHMLVCYTHLFHVYTCTCTLLLRPVWHTYLTGIAVSITTTANWTGNFIIALSTPILLNSSLHTHGTFFILAALLFLATTFVLFTLPETKVKFILVYTDSVLYSGGTEGHIYTPHKAISSPKFLTESISVKDSTWNFTYEWNADSLNFLV